MSDQWLTTPTISVKKSLRATCLTWRKNWTDAKRIGIALLIAMSAIASAPSIAAPPDSKNLAMVSLVGTHHMGTGFNVPWFAVDGNSSGPIGRGGGGGASDCCFMIPKKWRPGLTVDVRWSIDDWSGENREEIKAQNYASVKGGGIFRAQVPVEQYDTPDDLIVHIFPGGKVRVRVGRGLPGIDRKNRFVGVLEPATQGAPISEMFSQEEVEAAIRERALIDRGGNAR